MSTIVILFVLILCVACLKKRDDDLDESTDDIRAQFEQEHDSEGEEEEENPITLKEEDYNVYFPIIDTAKENTKGNLNEEICSICIDKVINNESVRKIRFCKHMFHSGCLLDWIKVNETCPNCKLELDKKNMVKLSQAEMTKKKANRIGLIDPNKKAINLMKMSKAPIESSIPSSRLRDFNSERENPSNIFARDIHVTKQSAQ